MGKRGAYAKGVAKREEILKAALELIAKEGFRGTSVRAIADAVGLSPAGLLHYFGSKEELFVAILDARDKVDAETFSELDFLDGFLSVMAHNQDVPGLVELYSRLLADSAEPGHPAREYFKQRREALYPIALQAVLAAQRDGSIRADLDPHWVMQTLNAQADGLQLAWLLHPEIDMPESLRTLIKLMGPQD